MADVERLPADLRRVVPASFIEARDALARRLRQEGDREGAAEARRLRRPSAPLWALNQLVEAAPDRLGELIRAGEALRATTQAVFKGEGADLGRLSSEHARLVEELTERAMELLAGLPVPATRDTRSRVWTLLRAASLDPDLAAALGEGSLAEEPAGGGFDSLLGLEAGAVSTAVAAPAVEVSPRPPDEEPVPEEASAEEEARARVEHEREVRDAKARVEHAEAEVTRRQDRRDRTRERAERLRSQLAAAAQDADQAASELSAAENELNAARELLLRLRDE